MPEVLSEQLSAFPDLVPDRPRYAKVRVRPYERSYPHRKPKAPVAPTDAPEDGPPASGAPVDRGRKPASDNMGQKSEAARTESLAPEDVAAARAAVLIASERYPTFTTDEVAPHLVEGFPLRALGNIMRALAREGHIEMTGELRKPATGTAKSGGRRKSEWRKAT